MDTAVHGSAGQPVSQPVSVCSFWVMSGILERLVWVGGGQSSKQEMRNGLGWVYRCCLFVENV